MFDVKLLVLNEENEPETEQTTADLALSVATAIIPLLLIAISGFIFAKLKCFYKVDLDALNTFSAFFALPFMFFRNLSQSPITKEEIVYAVSYTIVCLFHLVILIIGSLILNAILKTKCCVKREAKRAAKNKEYCFVKKMDEEPSVIREVGKDSLNADSCSGKEIESNKSKENSINDSETENDKEEKDRKEDRNLSNTEESTNNNDGSEKSNTSIMEYKDKDEKTADEVSDSSSSVKKDNGVDYDFINLFIQQGKTVPGFEVKDMKNAPKLPTFRRQGVDEIITTWVVTCWNNTVYVGTPLVGALISETESARLPILLDMMFMVIIFPIIASSLEICKIRDQNKLRRHGVKVSSINAKQVVVRVIRKVFLSPILLGVIFGIIFSFIPVELPYMIMSIVNIMADASLAVSIFIIGVFFVVNKFQIRPLRLVLFLLMKIFELPLIMYGVGLMLNLSPKLMRAGITCVASIPASVSFATLMLYNLYPEKSPPTIIFGLILLLPVEIALQLILNQIYGPYVKVD